MQTNFSYSDVFRIFSSKCIVHGSPFFFLYFFWLSPCHAVFRTLHHLKESLPFLDISPVIRSSSWNSLHISLASPRNFTWSLNQCLWWLRPSWKHLCIKYINIMMHNYDKISQGLIGTLFQLKLCQSLNCNQSNNQSVNQLRYESRSNPSLFVFPVPPPPVPLWVLSVTFNPVVLLPSGVRSL